MTTTTARAPRPASTVRKDRAARAVPHGWLVPACTFPENRQDLSVLRVVVRAGMSRDMADLFLDALRKQTAYLEALTSRCPTARPRR